MKVIRSVIAASALVAAAFSAAADDAADEGFAMLFAIVERNEAGDWAIPHDAALAALSGAQWADCAGEAGRIACTFSRPLSDQGGESSRSAIFGMIIAPDTSRCLTVWQGPDESAGASEAGIARAFGGPEHLRPMDLKLEWKTAPDPGPEAAEAKAVLTDAAQLLDLCPRIDQAMIASGKAF
ncbi:MAG: hypothetical protein Q4G25_12315 [Paracoccus sp. (in: a-proteobacteria)]|nr:hypothetical protein [Paracoccus sp. (in: a-proteobacteria)]